VCKVVVVVHLVNSSREHAVRGLLPGVSVLQEQGGTIRD
jgi:hypothetical protein